MKEFFNNFYKITGVIIIILPILILGILIKKDLVQSGQIEFIYDFSQDSAVITNLFPANRLSEINQIKEANNFWQQINKEPVYFETRLPQTFKSAIVEVVYKNQNQPLIQLGLRTMGESEWNYDFKPLENQILDDLDWPKIEDKRGTLWQREKNYLSLDQFLDKTDSHANFAAYHYPVERKFILPNYQPKNYYTIFDKTLNKL